LRFLLGSVLWKALGFRESNIALPVLEARRSPTSPASDDVCHLFCQAVAFAEAGGGVEAKANFTRGL
jgi:hypothetical protein